MPKINCCICSRRTDTNKQRTRIGTPSVWSLLEKHAENVDLDISGFSYDDYICMKCYSTISCYRLTDRGPNKKIKICEPIVFETIIKKESLRGYTIPVLGTVSSMWTLPEPDDVVLAEEFLIPMESVVDMEEVDPTVLTTNTEDWNLYTTADSPNDEYMSLEPDSEPERESEREFERELKNEPEMEPDSEPQNSSSTAKAVVKIQGSINTQSRCFICGSATGRKAIPWPAIQQVWLDKKCFVNKSNRTCSEHLTEFNKFSEEALKMIEPAKQEIEVNSLDFAQWLHEVSDLPKTTPYNFEDDGIPAELYRMFFGISKENFDDLIQYLPDMRNTTTRSVRTALAMFLLLLRNNMKQELIAFNFGTTQQVVSKTIDTVSASLEKNFVPQYLGYHHITRDEAIQNHSIRLTSKVLNQSESHVCLIADCTYNYIEKPSDFELQRKTFSAHKKRNLLKPLYIVLPTGYILEAAGPYFCDAKNNDAANIHHHYKNSDILLFLEEDDFFIFDRGFRDVVEETNTNGHAVFMPSLLAGKRTHFTCEEANSSRKVTMHRWVVEAVNARIKNVFPWFKHMIEGTYVPKIMRFNRIGCAILNKYFPPLFSNKEFHEVIAEVSENHCANSNILKEEIEELGIQRMTRKWEKANEDTIRDFPELSMDDLKKLTLGSYQIKIAEKYVEQHLREDSHFGIFVHRENKTIIRAQIQSRFSKSKTHNTWVKFDDENTGLEAIKGYYCSCKVGERTLGCCSHVATVIRYLGYDRHQPAKVRSQIRTAWDAIDCNNNNDVDSSADEEDD